MARPKPPPNEAVDAAHAIGYILIGAASAAFVVLDVVPVLYSLGWLRHSLLGTAGDWVGIGVWMAFFGVPLAYLVGSRHRAGAGCLAGYVLTPWMCCGGCAGIFSTADIDGPAWLALPLLQTGFVYLGIRTWDLLLARLSPSR